MGQILEAELVIKGSDKTGAAFAGVIRHAEELKKALGNMQGMSLNDPKMKEATRELRAQNRLVREQNAAWRTINETVALGNRELDARMGALRRLTASAHRLAHVGGMGWMVGGMASGAATHRIAHDTAEFSHQRAMLTVGGMKPDEVREAVSRSYDMRVPGMSAADNLRSIGELRMVFGSTEEALHNVEAVQRAAAALKAVNPHMNAESESYNLARALELKGVSNDPAHFNRLNNMMVQAINATHGKVNAEEFLAFTQYAGTGTARTLSDDFYARVAPTLIQEMHGNTAGRALATLRRQLVGGHMQLQSASEWMRLGLLDRKKVELDKIGHVKKVHPGALVDSELFVTNPYEWIHRYLAPALKKKGITDENKVAVELATLFSDRYAENMATIFLTQKQRIEKDRALIVGAPDTKSIDYARSHDALAAARDLAATVNTMLSAFGGPLTGPAIGTMNKLADWVHDLGGWYGHFQEKHPLRSMAASGAGALGLGYVGWKGFQALWGLGTAGPALNASAAALDGSAAALTAAAGRLGVAGGASAAGGAVAGGAGLGLAGTATAGAPVAAAILALGAIKNDAENGNPLRTYLRNLLGIPDDQEPAPWMSGGSWNVSRVPADGVKPLTLDGVRGALGGGYVRAEITGEGRIENKIVVSPSPYFETWIESRIDNRLRGISINGVSPTGTTGSTGHTMPEASSHQ